MEMGWEQREMSRDGLETERKERRWRDSGEGAEMDVNRKKGV